MNFQKKTLMVIFLAFGFFIYLRTAKQTQLEAKDLHQATPSTAQPREERRTTAFNAPKSTEVPAFPAGNPAGTVPEPPITSAPNADLQLPRGPGDLKEDEFLKKFRNLDVGQLLQQAPLRHFPNVIAGTLFVQDSGVIATDQQQEIQFRRFLEPGPANRLTSNGCVSIQLPDRAIVVGTVEDGTLQIYQGPHKDSFLLSINNKYFFLIYSDVILWEETRTNPRMTGVLIYYVRGADRKITRQGEWARWTDADPTLQLQGVDYCRYSFSEEK